MTKSEGKKFTEQIEVAGEQLVGKINELMKEGNARRVVIKDQDGKELVTVPLNLGVAAGGLVALAAPGLAAVGALAALVTKVKLEVERSGPAGEATVRSEAAEGPASSAGDGPGPTKTTGPNGSDDPTGHA